MVRTMFTKVAAGAVMALATFAWTSQADAFGHHHGGGYGGWGSSGGYGGGSSGGWGGSSGGWGSSGGSWGGYGGGYRHHGGWRWGGGSSGGGYYGGSSGGWGGSSGGGYWGGSSGGSSGGWGSSGGGSSGGTYYYSPGVPMTPVDPSVAPPAVAPPAGTVPPAPAAPLPGTPTSARADGLLAVNVPEDAKVFVNGQPTTSTGETRQYISRDLQAGYNYGYEVRAEVVRDGRTIDQVKKIDLRAGATANLAFDFPGSSNSSETSLTLHVPSDAKVYLAGNPTKAGGETRVFRTPRLNTGSAWEGYTVRVELDRGGRTLTKEETITLKGGESQELRFDFDGDKIASAR